MTSLIILVEEESMEATLDVILKKLNVSKDKFFILVHEGARDLEKKLSYNLRSWKIPNIKFLILRDNDNADCIARKQALKDRIIDSGVKNQTIIRIVCQELEAWFLGDPIALERAGYIKQGSRPNSLRGKVDDKPNPSALLTNLNKSKTIGKVIRAKEIAPHLDLNKNHSASFNHTIQSLKTLLP